MINYKSKGWLLPFHSIIRILVLEAFNKSPKEKLGDRTWKHEPKESMWCLRNQCTKFWKG